ncbi:MAG: hypothetical protein EP298_13115 [Gammaproteobacteria bacterium]|nr:MAG: hypothetical protein EP298_13115 [Gammaproteobacteria bacterium]
MVLIPFLFGLIFFLLLLIKVLGGQISMIAIVITGVLFIVPIIWFLIAWIQFSIKKKKNNHKE